ncbi:hypothetical protein ACFLWX_00265 [Chloroflexota bacterium]
MEGIVNPKLQIEAMHRQLRSLAEALPTVEKAFAREDHRIKEQEYARYLEGFRARIMQEVTNLECSEAAMASGHTRRILQRGLTNFLLSGVIAAAKGSTENPLLVGARSGLKVFGPGPSFGQVRVLVGPGGIPNDVRVIALSQIARKQGKTEAEVEHDLVSQSYHVMKSEEFSKAIDILKLKPSEIIPIHTRSVRFVPQTVEQDM